MQTTWASRALQSGVQPSVSFNFDQTLPGDIAFEYNVGTFTQETEKRDHSAQVSLAWAFQKEVVDKVAVFANGYTNTGQGASTSAVGGGLQWTPTSRTAVFTNISGGLNAATARFSALVGFAVAF